MYTPVSVHSSAAYAQLHSLNSRPSHGTSVAILGKNPSSAQSANVVSLSLRPCRVTCARTLRRSFSAVSSVTSHSRGLNRSCAMYGLIRGKDLTSVRFVERLSRRRQICRLTCVFILVKSHSNAICVIAHFLYHRI